MGSFEKPQVGKVQEEKKDMKHPSEVQIYMPDKEHMKRHDMQEKKDHDLSAMLQSNWAKLVAAEHRTHH